VSDEAALKAFNARAEAGLKAGVEATPTFFINGKKFEGEQSMEQLDAAIQPLLK
jgi:protein-disulfide isomerase